VRQDDLARVEPRRIEARVNGTVVAFRRVCRRRFVAWDLESWCYELGSIFIIVPWVWHVLLRYGRQVGDRVRNGIGTAKCEDEARVLRRVREGDVAAGV
jgi:hypothetical protein